MGSNYTRVTPAEVLRWLRHWAAEYRETTPIPTHRLPHVAAALTSVPPPEFTHEDRWEIPTEARPWITSVLRRAVIAAGGGRRELDRLRLMLAAVWADADLHVRMRNDGVDNWVCFPPDGSPCRHGRSSAHCLDGPDPERWPELAAKYDQLGPGMRWVIASGDGYDVVLPDEDDEVDPLNVAETRDVIQDLLKHDGTNPHELAGLLGSAVSAIEPLDVGESHPEDPFIPWVVLSTAVAGVAAEALALTTDPPPTAGVHPPYLVTGLDDPAIDRAVVPTGPPAAVRTTPSRVQLAAA